MAAGIIDRSGQSQMIRSAFSRRSGSFPWVVVGMLGLGVGATTVMFSVVNGVLLQPLAFQDSGQLVLVGERIPEVAGSDKFPFIDTPSAFLAWQRDATDFSGLAAVQRGSFTLTGTGRPQLLHGARVTANFFDVLGVQAQVGRLFALPDETDPSNPMVITDALWHAAFNADPAVIGRHVGPPGREARIVGVLPANFRLAGSELGPMLAGKPTEYFETLHFGPHSGGDLKSVFSNFNYTVLGRLRPGITLPHALAQLNVIQANLARTAPEKLSLYARLSTVRDYAVASARQELWLLLGGVGAVLLMVCVNLGGLWTTRIADHQRDWAIRAALGAAPGHLVRQVLGESLVLAVMGGVLGITFAATGLRTFIAAAPTGIPRLDEVQMDWRVLVFGLLLSVLAGLLTGVVPALRLSHADPQPYLKSGGAATTADRTSLRSRQGLIAVQAALSTLLLFLVGLLGLSFYRLITLPTGFAADHAMTADIVLNPYPDAQRDSILRQLPSVLQSIPGVGAAAFTSHLPLEGEIWIDSAGVPGRIYSAAEQPSVNVRFVSPGYFGAIGIALLAGRDLAESDRPAGWPPKNDAEEARMPSVVVISRATAELLWPGVPARELIGRKIVFNGQSTPTVIGVAADALDGSLITAPPSVVYQPYWEQPPNSVSVVVRSTLPAASLAGPLRAAVWNVAPNAPIPTLRPLGALKSSAVAPQRYQLGLLVSFAGVALLLAAMGVYALMVHNVTRRRKELAIRVSMGAGRGAVWALILQQALRPVAGGVVLGAGLALAIGRLLSSLLFGISAANPAVLTTVAAVVFLAAGAACLLPARRATRTDPMAALRAE